MKRLFNRGLVIFAATALIATLNVEIASAQRPGRGGGFSGGGRSGSVASRGSSAYRSPSNSRGFQSPNRGGYSAGMGRSGIRSERMAYNYNRHTYRGGSYFRPGFGYRPGFGRPYYRPYYSYYNFYRPFLGIRIGVLPYGYYPFYYGANQFYYSGGLFYQQHNNHYEVVIPPVGAEVPAIPEEANRVTINGVDYYEYKGVFYTEGQNKNGETVYLVAGKDGVLNTADGTTTTRNIGEIVTELPEGCREVTIKDEKYFVSPDDVYYEEVVDGTNISYRVIGKLF